MVSSKRLPRICKGLWFWARDPRPARPLGEWEVIELTEQEARAFATVGISLDDRRYVMPAGLNRIADELARHGLEPVQIAYAHVGFWGGSVSCSTHALSRAP